MKKFNVLDVVKLGKEKQIKYYLESERDGEYFTNFYWLSNIYDNGTCRLILIEDNYTIGKEIVANSADVFALPYYSTDLECVEFLSGLSEDFRNRVKKDIDKADKDNHVGMDRYKV